MSQGDQQYFEASGTKRTESSALILEDLGGRIKVRRWPENSMLGVDLQELVASWSTTEFQWLGDIVGISRLPMEGQPIESVVLSKAGFVLGLS